MDITANKNLIPYDEQPPMKTSGVRIGTAAVTTRGLGLDDMVTLGHWIADVLHAPADAELATRVRGEVAEMTGRLPIYGAPAGV